MKKFIGHIGVLWLGIIFSAGFIFSKADGYSDAFYLKFTGSKKSNLILGTSKAAQGLQPEVFQNMLPQKEFYNYAFAMYSSPYGKAYFESIQQKLNTDRTNQVFILSIDPWSLSAVTSDPNDLLHFRENKSFISGIINPNEKINYRYLFKYFDESYYKMLTKNSTAFLHSNGWLEVTLPVDSMSRKRRTGFTIFGYQDKAAQYKFSNVRLQYLIKTITFLKKYGQVFLLRLPVDSQLMAIENELMPRFDTDIYAAVNLADGYLDMSPDNDLYKYTDGVHLTGASGEIVSEKIGKWIKENSNHE